MNFSIYNFSNWIPRGPYCLSNMHLICVNTHRHNIKRQHIFEGQVLKVSSIAYLSRSWLHGIQYCTTVFSFPSKSCILWYVIYHILVFDEFLNNFMFLLSIERMLYAIYLLHKVIYYTWTPPPPSKFWIGLQINIEFRMIKICHWRIRKIVWIKLFFLQSQPSTFLLFFLLSSLQPIKEPRISTM
jgi:hypothetical protein